MSSDTAVEISTPASTTRVWPLGAMASTEMMLPGEAGRHQSGPGKRKEQQPGGTARNRGEDQRRRARI